MLINLVVIYNILYVFTVFYATLVFVNVYFEMCSEYFYHAFFLNAELKYNLKHLFYSTLIEQIRVFVIILFWD